MKLIYYLKFWNSLKEMPNFGAKWLCRNAWNDEFASYVFIKLLKIKIPKQMTVLNVFPRM